MKSYLQTTYNYIKDQKQQSGESVRFYNWIGEVGSFWFRKFIHSRKIPCDQNKAIAFFSVFGEKFPISIDKALVKVFFTGENLHRNEFGFSYQNYSDYLQNKHLDLSLGFDYFKDDSYLRFPLWVLPFVDPENTSDSEIRKICDKLSNPDPDGIQLRRFCSLVSNHDPNGLRKEIYDSLIDIDEVSCGGRFMNNTNELRQVFGDDKLCYLKQFKFNICPENSNAPGYVTEKLMEAVFSGAIPVYWGSDNDPEPDILSRDAIILWNKNGNNTENVNLIHSLHKDSQLYKDFYVQPRLKPDAAGHLSEMLWNLEEKLMKLTTSKISKIR
ncbi:MAG: hypothetical protein LBJ72_11505 [Dysgonamonadaceae bacterium]|jgi:hypothetical protein|nr:hypothetical protein [Dysgonamonadaceae bacterium]